jgi:hypothetical protein
MAAIVGNGTTASRVRWGQAITRRVPLARLEAALLLVLLAALPLLKQVDPDFWWHLRTGDLIAHHGIPRHDVYSWTAGGQSWVAHEWLSELLIWAVQSTFGYAASVALFSVCACAAIVLMWRLARDRAAVSPIMILLLALELVMFARFVTVRPQVFTWLLFALFVYVLERDSAERPARLWALPPLMALWANLHLGFIYGLMVVVIWAASLVLDGSRSRSVGVRGAAVLVAACFLTSMLNPSGPELLIYPLRYLQDHAATSAINEWQRPNFLSPLMAPYLLALITLVVTMLSRRRPGVFLLLLTVAALVLSLQAVRNLPFAALLVLPVVGPALPAYRRRKPPATIPVGIAASLAAGLAAVVMIAMVQGRGAGALITPSKSGYPSAGADAVASLGPGHRLFSAYGWGGYLIEAHPDVPVFIDGRSDFYRERIIEDYFTISRVQPGWQDLVSSYGIDVMLIPSGSELAHQLASDPSWRTVHEDDQAAVFLKIPSSA